MCVWRALRCRLASGCKTLASQQACLDGQFVKPLCTALLCKLNRKRPQSTRFGPALEKARAAPLACLQPVLPPHAVAAMASRASRLASFLEQKPLRSYPWARPKKTKQPPQINRWNILRGDKVVVVNGRHRGQSGIVQKVLRSTNRLIVEDVNVGDRMLYSKGDEDKVKTPTKAPRSIHYSNVNLVCPVTNLPTRVARRFLDDGTRVRVAVRSGAIIEKPAVLTERHKPRSTQAGPRDTPEDHVLEVTYDPVVDAEQWRRRELDEDGKRVLLKDD